MSDPKQQQPKILLHKPKKNQRVSSGVSAANSVPSHEGQGGARGVSTSSATPTDPKQPRWYRFRTALTTLLIVNAVLVGYTLFRTSFKPGQSPEEAETAENKAKESEEKSNEVEKEKARIVDTKNETTQSSKIEESVPSVRVVPEQSKVSLAPVPPQQMVFQEVNKPKLSVEQQQELLQWILSEKRKVKPKTKAEKAHIDAEKALLKEFLRGKRAVDV